MVLLRILRYSCWCAFLCYPTTAASEEDCFARNRGYKQLNTIVSVAFQVILKDGRYKSIMEYNAGFSGGAYSPTYIKDFSLCDAHWDRSEEPAGILQQIISTGIVKWCIHGGRSLPAFGSAEVDQFLQGVKAGEYYGSFVDRFHALTNTMSDILHVELVPEIVVVDATEEGFFEDMAKALQNGSCHSTMDVFFRHPYREKVVDFTCKTRDVSQGYGSGGLRTTDVAAAIAARGANFTACTVAGTTQASLIDRDFPLATYVQVDSVEDMIRGVCLRQCDITTDSLGALNTVTGIPGCVETEMKVLQIANPSIASDIAAITYRPPICQQTSEGGQKQATSQGIRIKFGPSFMMLSFSVAVVMIAPWFMF